MKRRRFLKSAGVAGAGATSGGIVGSKACGTLLEAAPAAGKPNIILILGDDRGLTDVGCYEIFPFPALDRD
jgi:hypothetical protein